MDIKALFKVSCGLYVTCVGLGDKLNGCITNTLMQHSHVPIKLSITVDKKNLTHDMIMEKKSLGVSAVSQDVTPDLIKHFGFSSGRDKDKFDDTPFILDQNGNPLLNGEMIAANFSLNVYQTVDMGTHTMFLCEPVDMQGSDNEAITYSQYQTRLKRDMNK